VVVDFYGKVLLTSWSVWWKPRKIVEGWSSGTVGSYRQHCPWMSKTLWLTKINSIFEIGKDLWNWQNHTFQKDYWSTLHICWMAVLDYHFFR
jgi:hypothetical protein